jgi:hypothetical protein
MALSLVPIEEVVFVVLVVLLTWVADEVAVLLAVLQLREGAAHLFQQVLAAFWASADIFALAAEVQGKDLRLSWRGE